jgi:hypothetical protein
MIGDTPHYAYAFAITLTPLIADIVIDGIDVSIAS